MQISPSHLVVAGLYHLVPKQQVFLKILGILKSRKIHYSCLLFNSTIRIIGNH